MQHGQTDACRVKATSALTQFQGRAWLRGAEPDQGQQHKAGSQEHGQQVEQQQEAKESEVGLDPGPEEAYGRKAGRVNRVENRRAVCCVPTWTSPGQNEGFRHCICTAPRGLSPS